jgi:hypothetical protein
MTLRKSHWASRIGQVAVAKLKGNEDYATQTRNGRHTCSHGCSERSEEAVG